MQEKGLHVMYDDVFLTGYRTAACETPERVQAIVQVLQDHYPLVGTEPATEADVTMVHSQSVLREVQADDELYQAAIMAVGASIQAAERALGGAPSFAAVRPPGHHASPGSHWGFCFFNNVAISVERLRGRGAISTALVLDIDLHFGDGTDNFFSRIPAVTVANIQENDRERFLRRVDEALSRHEYDIVAISAGFDRHVDDWGGTLKTEDYFTIGRAVRDYAGAKCNGSAYAVLEGGYNVGRLGANALALCQGLDPHA